MLNNHSVFKTVKMVILTEAKAHASLHICAVSQEPSLFIYTKEMFKELAADVLSKDLKPHHAKAPLPMRQLVYSY